MADFDDLRARIIDAEQTGNPAVFEELLADDAVILAPGFPPIAGREGCLEFVREWPGGEGFAAPAMAADAGHAAP